jgi:4-diphosphocytidyl-2-C-methyl-D-erythritol kinase
MMRAAKLQAQAKVNLFLRVGELDDSGYHRIETLFQRIDLSDDVLVRVGGSARTLACDGPAMPRDGLGPTENNLAFRAATAYAQQTGWPAGFGIELTKRIPVGGGLGGGSANAGAVLRALNALSPKPLPAMELRQIARTLGSDVPFLASDAVAALGSGRGEHLVSIPALAQREMLLVIPRFGISTSDAYRWLDGSRQRVPASDWVAPSLPWSWSVVERLSVNDFEGVVEDRYEELGEYRRKLGSLGARVARLSGSGSTVFGIFDDTPPAAGDLARDAAVIRTRTSTRVVQVEVL